MDSTASHNTFGGVAGGTISIGSRGYASVPRCEIDPISAGAGSMPMRLAAERNVTG